MGPKKQKHRYALGSSKHTAFKQAGALSCLISWASLSDAGVDQGFVRVLAQARMRTVKALTTSAALSRTGRASTCE